MVRWSVVFLLVAFIAGIIGVTAVSENEAFVARLIFFVFTVLFAAGFVLGMSLNGKEIKSNPNTVRNK